MRHGLRRARLESDFATDIFCVSWGRYTDMLVLPKIILDGKLSMRSMLISMTLPIPPKQEVRYFLLLVGSLDVLKVADDVVIEVVVVKFAVIKAPATAA